MKYALAALPLALLAAVAAFAAARLIDPADRAPGLSDGRQAPDRVFERLDGGEIAFNPPPGGAPAAVNLFASWCAPCEAEHPLLEELARRAPGRVYGVLYEDSVENGAGFLNRMGNPFAAVALDPEGKGGLDFGLTGVPETFVIGADGRVVRHVRGVLSPETVDEIAALLSE